MWINAGTVHWVQAVGWCNNIAWNVGPLNGNFNFFYFNFFFLKEEFAKLDDAVHFYHLLSAAQRLTLYIFFGLCSIPVSARSGAL